MSVTKINLAEQVSGALPVANGGTGATDAATALVNLGAATKAYVDGVNSSGTFASRPAAGQTGRLYFAQDNDTLYRDNGATWDLARIGSDSCDAMGAVPSAGWTAVNMQTGATWAADKDAMLFTVPTTGSTDAWQYQYRAYPTPPFTLTVYLDIALTTMNEAALTNAFVTGLVISDGTKLISGGTLWAQAAAANRLSTGFNIGVIKYTNVTTYSAVYNTACVPTYWVGGLPKWWRLVDDSTNLKWQYSINGVDWATMVTEARTAYLTPTRIGIGATNDCGSPALVRVRSWNGVS